MERSRGGGTNRGGGAIESKPLDLNPTDGQGELGPIAIGDRSGERSQRTTQKFRLRLRLEMRLNKDRRSRGEWTAAMQSGNGGEDL